jgi:HEAT repeat protein
LIFCKKCWTENPDNAIYCMECGQKITDVDLEKDIRAQLEYLKSTDPDVCAKAANKLSIYLNPNSQRYPHDLEKTLVLKLGVDPIVETLKNGDRRSKVSMAWCLGYLNNEISVKPLISSLSDEKIVGACIINLTKLGRFSTEPLINILFSKDEKTVNAAVESLGEIGDERAAEPLLNLLITDSKITYPVSNALSKIKSEKTVEPLIKLLKSDDRKLKRQSATILGNIGDKRAIEPLIEALNDKDAYLRSRTVRALGQINDNKVIDPILTALNDNAASVRGDAARSLGEIGEEIHLKHLEKSLIDKNENVKKIAQDAINKIKNKSKERYVPEWDGYYPSLDSATPEQKEFYNKWLLELNRGNYLDIEGNLSYIFVFLYDVINNFIKNKDIVSLINSFEMISIGYNKYEKLGRYLTGWKSDAFLYLDDKDKALEILISESEFNFRNALEYTILKADYNFSFINGQDIVNMMSNQGLTNFGRENKSEISDIVNSMFQKFHEQNGKPILKCFLEDFKLDNLTKSDLERLKNYFSNKYDFLNFKDVYEKEERNKKNIRYPGLALAEELEFRGFAGVPLSYDLDDPKFKKVIHNDYNNKKIYVPAIIIEAIKNEFKRILRKAENKLRIERGLPKIGEGWISETDLYYKIKESFPLEEIIHHGRPKWLGRQHLDIFFPKKNIGIEYQGEQHDYPVEFFGGEESFEKRKALDSLKKEKCDENGCQLIHVYPDYDFKEVKDKIKKIISNFTDNNDEN